MHGGTGWGAFQRVPVVGRGACEPTSACRVALLTHQRPEEQRWRGEMAQEQQGYFHQRTGQPGGPGRRGGDAVGGCCGVEMEAQRREVQAVYIVPVCLLARIRACHALL
jgi:hypothetical protein